MNGNIEIKDFEDPPGESLKKLSSDLRKYNTSCIGKYESKDLFLEIYINKVCVGSLYAVTKLGWLYIDLLMVHADQRGKGYGKDLLSRAEKLAFEKFNIKKYKLNTGNFQGSLEFYKKCGYEVYAELDIYPENADHNRRYIDYYLKKEGL